MRTAKTERAAKPQAGCAAGGQQPANYLFTPSVVRGKVRRPVRTVSTTSVAAPPGLRRLCMVRSLQSTASCARANNSACRPWKLCEKRLCITMHSLYAKFIRHALGAHKGSAKQP
ncbi:MAG: hypothetical protein DWI64_02465 [Chloroflexi bacterium]|nr:MAG: hypothetical protein DWI64_02465 [Chloroflexota bacterium]